ncbi:MAG: glycosyltransferase family 4 protein, partial [Actinomycetota bacterium]
MSEPLRIALCSAQGAGAHYYGPGMNAWRMYSRLDPRDGEVTLFHASGSQEPSPVFVATQQLARPGLPPGVRHLQATWSARRVLARARPQFDVFHAMTAYWPAVGPALAAERAGVPAVVKVAGEGTETLLSGDHVRDLPRRLRVVAMRRISAFVAISDTIADQLETCGVEPDRIWRIPNGVDTDLFGPPSSPPSGRVGRPRVLFAGAVVRRKRPHLAVRALARLRREVDAELWIAGPCDDPAYHDELRDEVRSLDLEDHVRWLGFVGDMTELYREVDAVCLPTEGEGMANVVLEAMASAVPFVVTPASGMDELAGTGAGLVVDSGPDVLAGGLATVLADPDPFARAGREAAVAHYSTAVVLAE